MSEKTATSATEVTSDPSTTQQAPLTASTGPKVRHQDKAEGETTEDAHARREGWRNRVREHRHARRAHNEALKVEEGLPEFLKRKQSALDGDAHLRLKRASYLMKLKNEAVAALAEFVGTFLFLFISFGVATSASQQNIVAEGQGGVRTGSGLDPASLTLSSLGFGFALAVNAFAFFRVSGGLFNPAVTLALFLVNSLTAVRAAIFVPIQIAGALAAAGIANSLYPGGIACRTRLSPTTSVGQGFVIEMLMTAQLIMAIFMLAGEKHKGTFIAPVGIGLALFICELWSTSLTGGSLNPARSLAPDVVLRQFDRTTWIYYAGPICGALISVAIYRILKWARYESANSGQDDDGMLLLMRDSQGKAQGYVEQVPAEAADVVDMRAAAEAEQQAALGIASVSTHATGQTRDVDLEAQVAEVNAAEAK